MKQNFDQNDTQAQGDHEHGIDNGHARDEHVEGNMHANKRGKEHGREPADYDKADGKRHQQEHAETKVCELDFKKKNNWRKKSSRKLYSGKIDVFKFQVN